MERLTEHHVNEKLGAYMICSGACIDDDFDCNGCEKLGEIVDHLAAYEDMMERWGLRDIAEAECVFQRVNALGGTDKMAKYKKAAAKIVHCRDCKHLYFKDMSAFCPHRVGPCKPSGFCDCGERSEGSNQKKA